MDNLLTVVFEAHSPEHNHHRSYRVTVGTDLLSVWTVAFSFGRVGQSGRTRRYSDPSPDALRALIRERLRRRLGAPKRIGCPYRLSLLDHHPEFDAQAWLPPALIADFEPSVR